VPDLSVAAAFRHRQPDTVKHRPGRHTWLTALLAFAVTIIFCGASAASSPWGGDPILPIAIRLTGLGDSPIEDVSFERMTITSTQGVKPSHVQRVTFKKVTVAPKSSQVFELTNARGVFVNCKRVEAARPR
jgi:hypothetical protein